MSFTELADRHDAIVAQLLDIEVELAHSKRQYFAGASGCLTMAERTALEAETAELRREKFLLTGKMNASRREQAEARRLSAHSFLVAMLTERGLHDLVKESERRASEQQLKGAEV